MEAVRVPPNGASQKRSEAVVIYKGRLGFVAEVGLTSFCAFPALLGAISGSLLIIVVYGPMALGLAFVASQHCSRVELYRNGKLVVHYFVRGSVTTWIEEVSVIKRDDDDGEFAVSFNRGTFRMSRNRSATSLVHALMRRKPTIALSGYKLPEL